MNKDVKEMLLSASGLFLMLGLDVLLIFMSLMMAAAGVSLFIYEKQDVTLLFGSAGSLAVVGVCVWKIRSDLKAAKKFDEKWSGKND